MILRKQILIYVVCWLVFTNFTSYAKHLNTPLPPLKSTQTRAVSSFSNIVAEGQISVHLHTGYAKPQIILRGDPSDLVRVVTFVKNDTLMLSMGAGYPKCGPVSAEVRGRYLHSFRYRGAGFIRGLKLHSGYLDLDIKNPGRTVLGGNIYLHKLILTGSGYTEISGIRSQNLFIKLNGNPTVRLLGVANISYLEIDGGANLDMHWVKADNMNVKLHGKAAVQLAGIANRMEVELWDQARFNGRYLRAKRVFVKTHGHSLAEIATVDRQHTLATDASDIYFFDIPELRADFMSYNGAVLDMRDLSPPDLEEYTPYNK